MTGRQPMTVVIDQDLLYSTGKGWAKQELKSIPGDPLAGYAIVFDHLNRIRSCFG
jgi:hypothetical protein